MRAVFALVALVAIAASVCRADVAPEEDVKIESDVRPIDLTAADFDQRTQVSMGMTSGNWFVMFYAPWCGHCKRMTPVWEEMARMTAAHGATIAKVDCTENGQLCRRFGVRSYPTVMLFARGKMYRYSGGRKVDLFDDYLKKGYLSEEGQPIPAPTGLLDDVAFYAKLVAQDVYQLYEQDPMMVSVVGAGLLLFFVIVTCLAARPVSSAAKRPAAPKKHE